MPRGARGRIGGGSGPVLGVEVLSENVEGAPLVYYR
jgi:hypothetical protein